jgi:hypothetical protein
MSTTLETRTLQQRAAQATTKLREVLHLDDLKVLSTALAEAAADEAVANPAFADRILSIYRELLSLRATRPLRNDRNAALQVQLAPIAGMDINDFDPYAPLDAYLLLRLYGSHQLRAALSGFTLAKLKQAFAFGRIEESWHETRQPRPQRCCNRLHRREGRRPWLLAACARPSRSGPAPPWWAAAPRPRRDDPPVCPLAAPC